MTQSLALEIPKKESLWYKAKSLFLGFLIPGPKMLGRIQSLPGFSDPKCSKLMSFDGEAGMWVDAIKPKWGSLDLE